jgi:hypothetical protein
MAFLVRDLTESVTSTIIFSGSSEVRVVSHRSLLAERFPVLIRRDNLSAHLFWIILFVAGTAAAVGVYFACGVGKPRLPGGSSPVGMMYGALGSAIMLFEFLIWPRKKVRAWRIGAGKLWMRAHIWLGLLTVPLIICHSGFVLGGWLSTVLMVLFGVVIVSGLFGLLLQQFLPRLLLEHVPAETIYSQIDHISRQYYWDAEDLVAATTGAVIDTSQSLQARGDRSTKPTTYIAVGAQRTVGSVRGKVLQTQIAATAVADAEPLRDSFLNAIGHFLLHGGDSREGAVLQSPLGATAYFQSLRKMLDPAAHPAVETLESLCDQRRQFDLQRRLHGWLHGWLCVHLPLSAALIGLMFVHIVVALKYW